MFEELTFKLESKNAARKNLKNLSAIECEAFDRVWLDRSSIGTDAEKPGIPEDIRQKALAEQERIFTEYDIDPEECTDFYHGYWSGILALCRFLSGEYGRDLDDLRYPGEMLDT